MSLNWIPEYSVKVRELDEQHKKLIDLINQVYGYIYRQEAPDKILDLVNEIGNHAVLHFNTEEGYFKKFNYPLTDEHENYHRQLLMDVANYKKQIISAPENFTIAEKFVDFLENWLADHMMIQDKKYGQFFNEHGLF